jgi:hypothetical protein
MGGGQAVGTVSHGAKLPLHAKFTQLQTCFLCSTHGLSLLELLHLACIYCMLHKQCCCTALPPWFEGFDPCSATYPISAQRYCR